MRIFYSLRYKMIAIFTVCILLFSVVTSMVISNYFRYILTEEVNQLTSSTILSMAVNVETYLEELDKLTKSIYMNADIMSAIKLREKNGYNEANAYQRHIADKAFYITTPNILQNTRKDVIGCVLTTNDGTMYASYKGDGLTRTSYDYPFKEKDWYNKAIEADGRAVFIDKHLPDYYNNDKSVEVFSVARLIKDPNTMEPLAVIMADTGTSAFKKIINNINFNVSSVTMILDDNYKVIYATDHVEPTIIQQIKDNNTFIIGEKDSYVLNSQKIENTHWKMFVLTSYSEITKKSNGIRVISLLIMLAFTFLAFILYSTLAGRTLSPFKYIISAMKKVEKGDFSTELIIKGEDELAQLGHALNHMIKKINELIEREYKAVLSQRESEYMALQSQINPHFLYNTLNGFIGLNRLNEKQLLEKSILALTKMLRYILEHKNWSTVENEMLFIRHYLDLQKLRFEERLAYTLHMDSTIEDFPIPKLLFQPLVENSIIHGLEPLERQCTITISAVQKTISKEEYWELIVEDDGVGFDCDQLDIESGVGLSNVKNRLMLAYNNSNLTINSAPRKGTKITMLIPFNKIL